MCDVEREVLQTVCYGHTVPYLAAKLQLNLICLIEFASKTVNGESHVCALLTPVGSSKNMVVRNSSCVGWSALINNSNLELSFCVKSPFGKVFPNGGTCVVHICTSMENQVCKLYEYVRPIWCDNLASATM